MKDPDAAALPAPPDAAKASGAGPGEPSLRQRKAALHRAALLEAAETVFAKSGYERASVSDIAAAAGLAVGTVYRFFPGKRELAGAVMERIVESRVENLRAVALPAANDRAAGLRVLVGLRVAHHVNHGAFLRMGFELQRSLGHREPPQRIKELFDESRALTREFFAVGLPRGFWRDLPPLELARAFDGICNEEIFCWERLGRPGGAEALENTVYGTVSALFFSNSPDRAVSVPSVPAVSSVPSTAPAADPAGGPAPSAKRVSGAVCACLALFAAALPSAADPLVRKFEKGGAAAEIRFEPGAVRPGETVEATVSATAGAGVSAKLPPPADFGDRFEGFAILGSYEDPDGALHFSLSPAAGAERRRLRAFPVEVEDSSVVPPARSWFAAGPLDVPEAPLPAAAGQVNAALRPARIAPSPKAFFEIAAAAAGIAALAFAALPLVRRLKRAAAVRRLPPKRRALHELDVLLGRGLPEKGRFKDFYSELALVVRRYVERRHGIRAPRQTTEEFLSSVSGHPGFPRETVTRLSEFLSAADLVKFAGVSATPEMAAAAAGSARAYLSAEPD